MIEDTVRESLIYEKPPVAESPVKQPTQESATESPILERALKPAAIQAVSNDDPALKNSKSMTILLNRGAEYLRDPNVL